MTDNTIRRGNTSLSLTTNGLSLKFSWRRRSLPNIRTGQWFGKLKYTPLSAANQSYEIEVIPYGELYRIALTTLR